jgi:hypothetical protein
MEHQVVTSKLLRTRLGTFATDLKYKGDELMFLVDKPGEDDYQIALVSVKYLRDNGISVPSKADNAKPKAEKKKK